MGFGIARQRIEKKAGSFVRVLQGPCLAAVSSLIDSRFAAIAAGDDIRSVRAKCLDAAEIQIGAAGYGQLCPRLALVGRAQNCSFGARDPDNIVGLFIVCHSRVCHSRLRGDANTAEVALYSGVLDLPRRGMVGGCHSKKNDEQRSHWCIVEQRGTRGFKMSDLCPAPGHTSGEIPQQSMRRWNPGEQADGESTQT